MSTPCRAPPLRNVLRALHQVGHLRGLGCDRERARLDAPGIEQIADQAAHVVGLLDDEAVELAHLGRVERRRLLHQRHRRALDGGERLAQLVAHQAQNSVRMRSISSSGARS